MRGICFLIRKKLKENRTTSFLLLGSFVGIPGLEPGKAGPESAVLPLHHIPIVFDCKVMKKYDNGKYFYYFFSLWNGKIIVNSYKRCCP